MSKQSSNLLVVYEHNESEATLLDYAYICSKFMFKKGHIDNNFCYIVKIDDPIDYRVLNKEFIKNIEQNGVKVHYYIFNDIQSQYEDVFLEKEPNFKVKFRSDVDSYFTESFVHDRSLNLKSVKSSIRNFIDDLLS
jgi:hypothetical protein